jgi:hypothetical protein
MSMTRRLIGLFAVVRSTELVKDVDTLDAELQNGDSSKDGIVTVSTFDEAPFSIYEDKPTTTKWSGYNIDMMEFFPW